jgi:hypothetical protein
MGVAYFIVLEHKIEGLDTIMDGKCLAKAAEVLDAVAPQLGVRPISEFISTDPEQAAEFLEDEGADVGAIKLPPLQQFAAQEGLTTVRALMTHVQSQPQIVKQADGVIQDLRECEHVLNIAAQHGVGWHFEIDF